MSSDDHKTATYISAGYDHNVGATDQNINDDINMGIFVFQRSHTFQTFNLGYGAYGFSGTYFNNSTLAGQVDNNKQVGNAYFTQKGFSGYGFNGSIDYFIALDKIDVRIVGLELGFNKESGDYLAYRMLASSQPNIFTDQSSTIVTSGVSSEVIVHNWKDKSLQYGFKLYLGAALGTHSYINTTNGTSSYNAAAPEVTISAFVQYHQFFTVLDANNGAAIRVGVKF